MVLQCRLLDPLFHVYSTFVGCELMKDRTPRRAQARTRWKCNEEQSNRLRRARLGNNHDILFFAIVHVQQAFNTFCRKANISLRVE